jgi:hypothetical protein
MLMTPFDRAASAAAAAAARFGGVSGSKDSQPWPLYPSFSRVNRHLHTPQGANEHC